MTFSRLSSVVDGTSEVFISLNTLSICIREEFNSHSHEAGDGPYHTKSGPRRSQGKTTPHRSLREVWKGQPETNGKPETNVGELALLI